METATAIFVRFQLLYGAVSGPERRRVGGSPPEDGWLAFLGWNSPETHLPSIHLSDHVPDVCECVILLLECGT